MQQCEVALVSKHFRLISASILNPVNPGMMNALEFLLEWFASPTVYGVYSERIGNALRTTPQEETKHSHK